MNRVLASLLIVAGLALVLGLPEKVLAAACCDESSSECKTGQDVGDKGTCSISGQVCVQIASECPDKKKHPGVLCDCGKPDSNISVNPPVGLTFSKKIRKDHFEVSNGGNVPLHLDISDIGDTGDFAVKSPKKCKSTKPTIPESDEVEEYSVKSAKATVKPNGCLRFPVKFKAHKHGIYTDVVDIKSDATETPDEVFYELFGTIGKP